MAKCIIGINDLQTINSKLALEWHPFRNGELLPTKVAYSSNKKVWWLGKCGHEWEATVGSRNVGKGCPICAGQKVLTGYNDLQTLYPQIAQEWVFELNEGKKACQILAGSHKKAVWKCSKCSYIWKAEIRSRIRGNGCPQCGRKAIGKGVHKKAISGGNTLADLRPELLIEWNYEKNKLESPENVTPQSATKVWWVCKKCKYEWISTVHNRANGSGCPACAGHVVAKGNNDLLSQSRKLALEWNYQKNGTLRPENVHFSSGRNVWWVCKFGHEWKATVHDRKVKNTGCPVCSRFYRTSFSEQSIYYYVLSHFPKAINSYKPDWLDGKEIDIYIPEIKIGIEYDGYLYHKKLEKDKVKDKLCAQNGIKLIRVRENGCPQIKRDDPVIYLKDNSNEALSIAIVELLRILGLSNIEVNVEKEKQNIYEIFHSVAVKNSIAEIYPNLALEWSVKNGLLKPENIPAYKTKTKYIWQCQRCNNEWSASLSERIRGTKCPVCSNKKIVVGVNDFFTTHRELMKEWHFAKNAIIDPHNITFGSQENVWWKCSKCGYEWNTRVNRRVNGSGCPRCARQRRKKGVVQMTLNGEYIREFNSLTEAAQETGVSESSICNACKKHKVTKGYLWVYKDT